MIKVSVLNENTAGGRGFLAEHGLSLLLESGAHRYLFDTGQSSVFMKNAAALGEELTELDGIILSHGHFDHCGGLAYLAELYSTKEKKLPPVYIREEAFLAKTAINPNKITYRNIGITWNKRLIEASAHFTKEKEAIADSVWVLGNIPYTVAFEKKPEQFFIDEGQRKRPDYMEDEQLLVFETKKGLCVFAGCCHAGIINCLTHVTACFPGTPIYSVFAGMHLMNQTKERIEETIEALKKMDITMLIPVHCTGLEAIGSMKAALGEGCRLIESGKVFEIE